MARGARGDYSLRMYLRIGGKPSTGGLTDLLLECHGRIRNFVAMARRVGEATDVPDEEIREAAHRVHRYFAEALPRHVADEEESIVPRLLGRSDEVDRALALMQAQHAEHEPLLAELLAACAALQDEPGRSDLRERLLPVARSLEKELEIHLANEEQVIFPALRTLLGDEDRRAIAEEMRARRDRS